jgi:hypothetical protein
MAVRPPLAGDVTFMVGLQAGVSTRAVLQAVRENTLGPPGELRMNELARGQYPDGTHLGDV